MLEPIYNQLGETFKNEDSVRITRINAARPENAIEGPSTFLDIVFSRRLPKIHFRMARPWHALHRSLPC